MKSKLDKIEQYLQQFIEGNAHLFPWGDERAKFTQNLVAAMVELFYVDEFGALNIPTAFAIQLHPKIFGRWQSDEGLIENLSASLQEAAIEAEIPFTSKPVIILECTPELSENDIRIYSMEQRKKGVKTAVLSPEKQNSTGEKTPTKQQAFLIMENGDHFRLETTVTNIGRRHGNHLVLDDLHVSREHAQIRSVQGNFILFDLNSAGGTFVNGRKITQHDLQSGDVISLSGHPLIYVEDHPNFEESSGGQGITMTSRMDGKSCEEQQ